MIVVKIPQVFELIQLAKKTPDSGMKYLMTRQVEVTLSDNHKVKTALKVFLNGAGSSQGESMSVYSSLIRPVKDNFNHEYVVSFFLKRASATAEHYRKSYHMSASNGDEPHSVWKGCQDFIGSKKLKRYIQKDASLFLGVMIISR